MAKRGFMKKITLITCCAGIFLAGCTSPEQDQKIQAFWFQQYANLMLKVGPLNIPQAAHSSDPADFAAALKGTRNQRRAALSALLTDIIRAQQQQQPQLPQPAPAPETQPKKPVKPKFSADMLPQIVEVTMDEEALPGKANYEERVRMAQAFSDVLVNNQATLQDVQDAFGESVKLKVFLITTGTETKLKEAAATANDFPDYLAKQRQLLQVQEKELQQLMTQNINSLKKIRNTSR